MSRLAETAETVFVPLFALLVSAIVLAAFVAMNGADPWVSFRPSIAGDSGPGFRFRTPCSARRPSC